MRTYVDLLKDDLVDPMVRVDFQDLLEVGERVVLAVCREHLCLLDFVHEGAVAVAVRDHHARLIRQPVGNDDVVDLFEEQLLGVLHVGLVLFGQKLEHLPLALAVVGHLEVALAHVHNVLNCTRATFPSYSLSTLKTYSSMGSSQSKTSYPLRTSPTTRGDFSSTLRSSPLKK